MLVVNVQRHGFGCQWVHFGPLPGACGVGPSSVVCSADGSGRKPIRSQAGNSAATDAFGPCELPTGSMNAISSGRFDATLGAVPA